MSSISADSARDEIRENALVVGNPVKNSSKVALSTPNILYSTSAGVLSTSAPIPVTVSSSEATTTALLSITGSSTLSATGPLTNTLVAAAAVTTFTATGYARVAIVDDAGNITAGNHYVEFGTLA